MRARARPRGIDGTRIRSAGSRCRAPEAARRTARRRGGLGRCRTCSFVKSVLGHSRRSPSEAEAPRRPRRRRQEPALQEALEVEGHVEAALAQAASGGGHVAERRELRAAAAPSARVGHDDVVDGGVPGEQRRFARFRHPRHARVRSVALQRRGHGQRVDDVADRRELDDRDVQRLSSISPLGSSLTSHGRPRAETAPRSWRSRRGWRDASRRRDAVAAPTAADVARSGNRRFRVVGVAFAGRPLDARISASAVSSSNTTNVIDRAKRGQDLHSLERGYQRPPSPLRVRPPRRSDPDEQHIAGRRPLRDTARGRRAADRSSRLASTMQRPAARNPRRARRLREPS